MIVTRWKILAVAAVLIGACHEQGKEGAPAAPATAIPPATAEASESKPGNLDQWIGRWNGPEGTYLSVAKHGEGYALEIADLDGPKTYEARSAGDHLEFERNGKIESLRATDGKQTGMKWLQEKQHCLTISVGDGFCRD
jgi:hypothetical protein